jgi:DNA (cytosine-5)-methyltransferase 1
MAGGGGQNQITAVENDPKIAEIYKIRFPDDEVIMGDAYEFFHENMEFYDFIWASPPCQTHSRIMKLNGNRTERIKLPDFRLYSLIVYLTNWFKGSWCVENVIPYYEPLIKPSIHLERHYFWLNKPIAKKRFEGINIWIRNEQEDHLKEIAKSVLIDYNLLNNLTKEKRIDVLRNCVHPYVSEYIFNELTKSNITLNKFLIL